jgi:ribonuclease-3
MLSSVIAAHLFNKAPHGDEGYLTKMRSKIVSREHLNELGKDLNLFYRVKYLYNILRKHTRQYFLNLYRCHLPRQRYIYCEKFIQKRVIIPVDISRLGKVISYKSLVIEWCQKRKVFHYDIYEDNGIDGTRFFM